MNGRVRGLPSLLALLTLTIAPEASGQGLLVPPRAIETPRVLDWATVFPRTPPFREWERFQSLDDSGAKSGNVFLYPGGVREIPSSTGTMLEVDTLDYRDAAGSSLAGYQRILWVISCGTPIVAATKAYADVTIDPDGFIRPASQTLSGLGSTLYNGQQNMGYLLCFDPAYKRFFFGQ